MIKRQLSERQLSLIRNVNDKSVTSIIKILGLHREVCTGIPDKIITVQKTISEVV